MSATAEETSLPADIALGAVSLTVSDLDAVASFYERAVGLGAVERSEGRMRLGVEAGRPLVELVEEPDAPPPPDGARGSSTSPCSCPPARNWRARFAA